MNQTANKVIASIYFLLSLVLVIIGKIAYSGIGTFYANEANENPFLQQNAATADSIFSFLMIGTFSAFFLGGLIFFGLGWIMLNQIKMLQNKK